MIQAPRRVPIVLKYKLRNENYRMKRLSIIEESYEWVNSMVIVEKPNGKLRICLNPSDLNKATKRHYHHHTTNDEIVPKSCPMGKCLQNKMPTAKFQLTLTVQKLLMFISLFGQHRFKRMLYGLHCASEVFQGTISKITYSIENAENSQGIIVWQKDLHTNNKSLNTVFQRIRSHV